MPSISSAIRDSHVSKQQTCLLAAVQTISGTYYNAYVNQENLYPIVDETEGAQWTTCLLVCLLFNSEYPIILNIK